MMEFSDNKPIYRQIEDYSFNCIMEGRWTPGARIPSVREMAGELGVNTRTVLKAMEDLQSMHVIEPRRGMGFMLAEDAPARVREARRREFFESTLPALRAEMQRLEITGAELMNELNKN